MNKKALVFAAMAVCLGSATSAFAQDRYYNNYNNERSYYNERNVQQQRGDQFDRDGDGQDDRYQNARRDDGRYQNDGRNDYRRNDYRRDDNRGYSNRGDDRRYASGYGFHDGYRGNQVYRGAGPRHDLHRGARLSHRSSYYVVTDWRSRRLSAPPYGTHWVQAGNDYVLVAIATGIIAQVLLGN